MRRKGHLPGRYVPAHLRKHPERPWEYVDVSAYQEHTDPLPSKTSKVSKQGELDLPDASKRKGRPTMTKEDARRATLSEWHVWSAGKNLAKPTGTDAMEFFNFLQRERDHLLAFRTPGDKWQIVHGWLLRAGVVSD